MTARIISHELFHLVGHEFPDDDAANYETLCAVLRSGCVSHPPHDGSAGAISYREDWSARLEDGKLIVPTVTCYADIPFENLSVHARKYGYFGLAFPRHLLVKHGARPVIYVPMWKGDTAYLFGRTFLRHVQAVMRGFEEQCVRQFAGKDSYSRPIGRAPRTVEDAVSTVESVLKKDFLAFIKPFDSELPDDHLDNYYMEREWRAFGNLRFQPEDVSRIVVRNGFGAKLLRQFPAYEGRIDEI